MSKLGGATRTRALASLFVLALIAVALPLAAPAAANHGTCVLDLTPETDTNTLGEQHTITASLRPAGTDPNATSTATCTTREGGRIDVNFEVTGETGATYSAGTIDPASTPGSPDLSCSMNPNQTTCTVTYARTAVAGTDTIVGFFSAHGTAGQTDTVTKTWVAPTATRLDCAPETDTNPTGTAHVITCTATTTSGQPVNGVNVDVELTGTADPDGGDTPTTPDLTCTTAGSGTCTVTHTSNNTGTTTYRAWIDSDNNNATFNGDATEAQAEATTPGATAEPDTTDVVTKTWTATVTTATRLDCNPETDTNPTGTAHVVTCTATNNSGQTVAGAQIDVEVAGANDPDNGDTFGTPDLTCTTNNQGVCSVTHGPGGVGTTATTGTTTYRAWIDFDQDNATGSPDLAEGQASNTTPGTTAEPDHTDVVTKTWTATLTTATRLDCNPETDTNPVGTAHVITCTATNNSDQTVAGAQIDVEVAGANDPDNGDTFGTPDLTCTTNAQGVCSVTHGPGGVGTTASTGTTTYRAWIDFDQDNATGSPDLAEGQASNTTPGTTAERDHTDVMTKIWTSGPAVVRIAPTSDSASVGTCNAFTITVLDSANQPVAGVTLDVEQIHALATNNVTNDEPTVSFCTPTTGANPSAVDERLGDLRESPDNRGTAGGETTTPTNSAGQVTIGIAVAPGGGSDGTGNVTLTAFTETTDNDDPDAADPRASATKTWVVPEARTIDCEPETASAPVGTQHTITCTVRDRFGDPLPGVSVTFTETGEGAISGPTTAVTGATGTVAVVVTSTTQGAQAVTATLTDDLTGTEPSHVDPCDRAANDPAGSPAGVCADSVAVTWTAPPPGATCPGFEADPRNQIVGTEGDDVLEGTAAADIICGLGGDDTISGGDGNDLLIGGGGKDAIEAGLGDDTLFGEGDKDILLGEDGNDELDGGQGNDIMSGGGGADVLLGRGGWDTLKGNAGDDLLVGAKGRDILQGGAGNDTVRGGADDDVLKGYIGNDTLRGGGGDDIIKGAAGRDRLFGNAGNDILNGGAGRDTCRGGRGVDTLRNCP